MRSHFVETIIAYIYFLKGLSVFNKLLYLLTPLGLGGFHACWEAVEEVKIDCQISKRKD